MAHRLNSFVLSGLVALALAALGWFDARRLRLQSVADGLGAAFFPWLLVGVLVLLGVCLLAVGLLRPTGADTPAATGEDGAEPSPRWVALAVICAALGGYAVLLVPLGFPATTAGFIFVTALALSARPFPAAILALLTTAALYGIFAVALRVPLP